MAVKENGWKERQAALMAAYPTWPRRTLSDHIDEAAKKYLERPYLITRKKIYSYREVLARVDQAAKGLMALGIKAREHVILWMGNYAESVFLTLALNKIGAVVIPLNFMLKEVELKELWQDSDAVAVIFNDRLGRTDYVRMVENICPELKGAGSPPDGYAEFPKLRNIICYSPEEKVYQGLVSLSALYDGGKEIRKEELHQRQAASAYPDEICHILYTSGTVGAPKGAMLTHDMLLRNAYISGLGRSVGEGQCIYCPLPLYHVFALVEGILTPTFVGGSVVVDEQFAPSEAIHLMEKNRVQELLCVPSILLALLNCPEKAEHRLESLRTIFCAATPAPRPIWERVRREFGSREMLTGYGMTEVSAATVMTSPDDSLEVLSTRVGRLLPANCSGLPEFGGRNVQYKVVDPVTGEELPAGSKGEFICRGNIVSKGYYKRPLETGALIDKDGWLHTGDLGIIHADGLFELSGRSKEIYRVSGESVMPKEVEDVLTSYQKVNQAYVVGVPDSVSTEIGAAFIELNPGEKATRKEILEFARARLAKFKLPKYVFFIRHDDLPFTSTGKIQKFLLVEKATVLKSNGLGYVGSESDAEIS
ncbi:AMP-dependent synthetase/ligase [Acididesulfobacillus acetoxydans]|uniref:AMP-dependent synthetase/ligase n=1 Tax=Acididesulfobacillus acetoxydans TaxID=1561005 RepID=A0A8S0WLZ5_9FIRM|nr:AMP-binding protein [Acididesulfobacillus acetoxydans]CAA7600264.1 AMP-dependent synthetase/ligase [Acididesulfobacillus acetoxydans]CEJ09642.1 Acyl-CoA synthetase member 2, mitochondrial [Acididesulfobacillus acetoxydans]